MVRYLFIILLLIPIRVMSSQTVIGSVDLPYTASASNDTITFDADKITTTGSGIIVTGDDVIIQLRDDTLEFGTDYGDNYNGILISQGADRCKIYGNPTVDNGGLILHGGGTNEGVDSSWDCRNVYIQGDASYIEDVNMEIYGWDGRNVLSSSGGIDSIHINGGRYINHVEGFTSRCNFDASVMKLRSHEIIINIHDIVVDCWHNALFIQTTGENQWQSGGAGKATIYNCSLFVDAKNDLYSFPSGNFCHTSALSAGITLWKVGAGTAVYNNYILAGIDNEGCEQGIAMNYGQGTPADTIQIYNNVAILHRGRDDHYGDITTKGYKQRWSNRYVHIHDNTFTLSAHPDSGDHAAAYGKNAEGIEFAVSITGGSLYSDSFVVVENNHVEIIALDAGCVTAGMRMSIDLLDQPGGSEYNWQDAGNIWKNNYLSAFSVGYDIGKSDGTQGRYFKAEGDTVNGVASGDYNFNTYEIGFPGDGYSSIGNIFKDLTYQGDAAFDDVTIIGGSGNDSGEAFIERTINIYSWGNDDSPIEGAACSVWNDYDILVLSGVSDGGGVVSGGVRYYHDIRDYADSVYNNHVVHSWFDGEQVTDSSYTVAYDTAGAVDTLTYTTKTGGGSSFQTNTVIDTNKVTVDIKTAFSGVDGSVSGYKLMLDGNDPPTTKIDSIVSPTNPDTLTASGLSANTKYYFKTITVDDSNVDTTAVDSITTLQTVSHVFTQIDSTETTFDIENNYVANTVDTIWMIVDDDTAIADPIFIDTVTAGITDPDTLSASGLTASTKYYYRMVIHDQLGVDTSAIDSITTLASSGFGLEDIDSVGNNYSGKAFTITGDASMSFEAEGDPGGYPADCCYGWWYFKVNNMNGETLDMTLTNPAVNWQYDDDKAFYSNDSITWQVIDSANMVGDDVQLWQDITSNSVWFSMSIPYTAAMLEAYADAISSTILERDTLGTSVNGRPIHMFTITDTSVAVANKKTVWLISRQHPMEVSATWNIQGLIGAVKGDSAFSTNFRKRIILKIVPMVNIDGVDSGWSRWNQNGGDLNRDWKLPIVDAEPEVEVVHQEIFDWFNGGDSIELFIDMHSGSSRNDFGFRLDTAYITIPEWDRNDEYLDLQDSYDSWQNKNGWALAPYGSGEVITSMSRLSETYGVIAITTETPWAMRTNVAPRTPITQASLIAQGDDWAHAIYDFLAENRLVRGVIR